MFASFFPCPLPFARPLRTIRTCTRTHVHTYIRAYAYVIRTQLLRSATTEEQKSLAQNALSTLQGEELDAEREQLFLEFERQVLNSESLDTAGHGTFAAMRSVK